MNYRTVKLILKPTDEQKVDLDNHFQEFTKWCAWLNENCPKEIKKYKFVVKWAYPHLRRKGLFSLMIVKIAAKVSQHRIKKLTMDCNYIFCDRNMFAFSEDSIRIKLVNRKIHVKYEIASGKNTKSQIHKCLPQSGVLYKGNEDYIFHLRLNTPMVLTYSRKK